MHKPRTWFLIALLAIGTGILALGPTPLAFAGQGGQLSSKSVENQWFTSKARFVMASMPLPAPAIHLARFSHQLNRATVDLAFHPAGPSTSVGSHVEIPTLASVTVNPLARLGGAGLLAILLVSGLGLHGVLRKKRSISPSRERREEESFRAANSGFGLMDRSCDGVSEELLAVPEPLAMLEALARPAVDDALLEVPEPVSMVLSSTRNGKAEGPLSLPEPLAMLQARSEIDGIEKLYDAPDAMTLEAILASSLGLDSESPRAAKRPAWSMPGANEGERAGPREGERRRFSLPSAAALNLAPVLVALLSLVLPALLGLDVAWAAGDPDAALRLELGGEAAGASATAVKLLVVLTLLAVAPAIILSMTSFTRLIVVFSLLRQAIGVQQAPPNQVLVGLALFLTWFTMAPVFTDVNEQAVQPYFAGELNEVEAIDSAMGPMRGFMMRNTRDKDLGLFMKLNRQPKPSVRDEIPSQVLIPAFIISELKTAFQVGFLIYIPFLVIDIVVSTILLAMGMMVLPPVVISMPFKLLLFVFVDGWNLLVGSMVQSFN